MYLWLLVATWYSAAKAHPNGREQPTEILRHPHGVEMWEHGGNVRLYCQVKFDFRLRDSLDVYWMFDDGMSTYRLENTRRGRMFDLGYIGLATLLFYPYQTEARSYQTLTIYDILPEDEGVYICVAKTGLDEVYSIPARITVKKQSKYSPGVLLYRGRSKMISFKKEERVLQTSSPLPQIKPTHEIGASTITWEIR